MGAGAYEAQHAEQDVDDGVGGADAALDPDCPGESVTCANRPLALTSLNGAGARGGCDDVPGRGGKMMAKKPRNTSEEHMVRSGIVRSVR